MIADDDDVQNMPNMIDLEDTQPSKETVMFKLPYGLYLTIYIQLS